MIEERYQGRLVEAPTLEAVRAVIGDYEIMLVSVLDAMIERFERDPDYPYIDTKLSLLTGEDFPTPADDSRDFRGKSAVYGWIQGRGLEALVGHIRWLPECTVLTEMEKEDRVDRLREMVEVVFEQMERVRAVNGGRVWFVFDPRGRLFDMDEQGRRRAFELGGQATTIGDLFYAKGMLAAASLLGRADKVREAHAYLDRVLGDVEAGCGGRDRFSFDPKNQVEAVPGRHGHASRMIGIGALALAVETLGGPGWYAVAERFMRHVLDRHVNQGQMPELQAHDFVEYVDDRARPWRQGDGQVLSDPGHSLEFVGLAGKLLLLLNAESARTPGQRKLLDHTADLLPRVLLKNVDNGFNRNVGGICKAVDLLSRTPINTDMPWWNLPETMRAAAEMLVLAPRDPQRREMLQVIADCSNAFVRNFVNRRAHLMAYQTVNAEGEPVDVIPATPDADPGYHTGLSIIDWIRCVRSA